MGSKSATDEGRNHVLGLVLLMGVSFAFRSILVLRGGQGFWGDESRYNAVYEAIASADLWKVSVVVMGSADHLGFKVLSVIPALLQLRFGGGYQIATFFLSLLATSCIGWMWLIARRAGADHNEALGVALVFACSNTLFYWSRHLVPYDAALFWGLACLFVALKPAPRVRDSVFAGVLGLLAFVTYTGYWTWVALVLGGHVLLALPNRRMAVSRAAAGLLGLVGGFGVLLAIASFLGANLWQSFTQFAGTITQGDYREGHLVIGQYLWSAESAGLVVWLAALLGLVAAGIFGLKPARRGWLWLGGASGVVFVLVLGSNVFEAFVVYGRVVRQVVPFFALLAGYVIFGLKFEGRWVRPVRFAAVTTLIAAAAWNFFTPLVQEFPNDFHYRSALEIERLRRDAEQKQIPPLAPDRFRFVNVGFIWPVPTPPPDFGKFRELRVRAHPLAYPPFLHEGFKRAQREEFNKADIRMKLIVLED